MNESTMEVNYTVPQIAGDPSRPVYVVMHYRETHDTPAPMEGGYNIARTVYVTSTIHGALDYARRFRDYRKTKITCVDHDPVEPAKNFQDHHGLVIGDGWQLDVRKEPAPDSWFCILVKAGLPEDMIVSNIRDFKIVGRELIWVEKQWMSTVC